MHFLTYEDEMNLYFRVQVSVCSREFFTREFPAGKNYYSLGNNFQQKNVVKNFPEFPGFPGFPVLKKTREITNSSSGHDHLFLLMQMIPTKTKSCSFVSKKYARIYGPNHVRAFTQW